MPFTIHPTPLEGNFEIAPHSLVDSRGQFTRLFCHDELQRVFAPRAIRQINHSRSARAGTMRGLHFQNAPHAEGKWVQCLRGRVWDVAVDLRRGSRTLLQWHAVELDGRNLNAVFIPEGCAHGFQVLEADSELLYLHTAMYEPDSEDGVAWDDPRLSIRWPLPVSEISDRDRRLPCLPDHFEGIDP